MGPSTRTCKAGDVLNLKLNFTNKQVKMQQSAAKRPPIKMMIFINEVTKQDNFGNPASQEEDFDDSFDEDVIGDRVTFKVSYESLA